MKQKICAVYQITNLVNGKRYIGSSSNAHARANEHLRGKGKRGSRCVSAAVKKYGIDNFKVEWVQICSREQLAETEFFWIKELKPEYNLTVVTITGGWKHTPETIEKFKKRIPNARTREAAAAHARGNQYAKGHKHTPEALAKMSAASSARKRSPEWRAKMSERMKGTKYNLGRKRSPEAVAKSAEKVKGRKNTPEQMAKWRESRANGLLRAAFMIGN